MVFIGLFLIVTNYVETNYRTLIKGFIFHLMISLIVIPIDFMMYKSLGGVPIFEDIATKYEEKGLQVLNPLMMLILYFLAFNVAFFIPFLVKKIKKRKKH